MKGSIEHIPKTQVRLGVLVDDKLDIVEWVGLFY